MGYIAGAHGIRGGLRVSTDTEFGDSLLEYDAWWIGRDNDWRCYALQEGAVHGKGLIVQLEGVSDRTMAEAMRGATVAIPRSAFAEADEDEFYWADLVGLQVINRQGECLGQVARLLASGAHDILVVAAADQECLVPFVEAYVDSVDIGAGEIRVDWQRDW